MQLWPRGDSPPSSRRNSSKCRLTVPTTGLRTRRVGLGPERENLGTPAHPPSAVTKLKLLGRRPRARASGSDPGSGSQGARPSPFSHPLSPQQLSPSPGGRCSRPLERAPSGSQPPGAVCVSQPCPAAFRPAQLKRDGHSPRCRRHARRTAAAPQA